jgi:hypothetical protein
MAGVLPFPRAGIEHSRARRQPARQRRHGIFDFRLEVQDVPP